MFKLEKNKIESQHTVNDFMNQLHILHEKHQSDLSSQECQVCLLNFSITELSIVLIILI
jgi:hypothetical protein